MGSAIQTALINLILAISICNLQIVAKIACGVSLGSVALLGIITQVIFFRRSENSSLVGNFTGNRKMWYRKLSNMCSENKLERMF